MCEYLQTADIKVKRYPKNNIWKQVVTTGFMKEGDFRDWNAVREWAERLALMFDRYSNH